MSTDNRVTVTLRVQRTFLVSNNNPFRAACEALELVEAQLGFLGLGEDGQVEVEWAADSRGRAGKRSYNLSDLNGR